MAWRTVTDHGPASRGWVELRLARKVVVLLGGCVGEADRRRREFIRVHHPDRGGDPEVFIAGLRAFEAEQDEAEGPLPRVVVVRRRGWLVRAGAELASWLRRDKPPPRVH